MLIYLPFIGILLFNRLMECMYAHNDTMLSSVRTLLDVTLGT